MKLLTLDFETYFDASYSLGKLTTPEYVHDARFHIHGLAVRHPDGQATFEFDAGAALRRLQEAYGTNLERITVLVHNGHFDLYVMAKVFGILPPYTVDTLQLAHALHGRKSEGGHSAKLADLAQSLGLPAKGSIASLQGCRLLDGRQRSDLAEYAKYDVQLTYRAAEILLPQLSRPDVELPIAAHTLRLHHERGLTVDTERIDALIGAVQAETQTWLAQAGVTATEAGSRKDFARILGAALARTNREVPTKPGKGGMIPATSKKDQAMVDLLEDADPVVAALAHARLAKGSEGQQVARLETLRRIARATGGQLPVHLVYHGAGTGRFAGGGKFNLQNLTKCGAGSAIRDLIRAPAGKVLVLVDLAQIECRVTAWLAGEEQLLRAFADGIDIYSREASAIFCREVRKPCSADTPEDQALLDAMRQTGKQEVLGLGFGMGALRFMQSLQADPKTARLFNDGLLSPTVCRAITDRFRQEFAGVPRLWKTADDALRNTVLCGGSTWIGHAQVLSVEGRIDLRLPSGRVLRYPQVRLEPNSGEIAYLDSEGSTQAFTPTADALVYGSKTRLFGGKIVENLSQAIARDIFVEAILRLEQRGIKVVLHIHDEVIAMCPEQEAEATKQAVITELTRAVPWAPGLPLAADGRVSASLAKGKP